MHKDTKAISNVSDRGIKTPILKSYSQSRACIGPAGILSPATDVARKDTSNIIVKYIPFIHKVRYCPIVVKTFTRESIDAHAEQLYRVDGRKSPGFRNHQDFRRVRGRIKY